MAPVRRKSHGSIRSPRVKRDSESQVTIEGWLYKLEGGTIKQWKQRWCVLADFCLFLYKGPHEDKLSSSVLLPSYKISPCSTDDRTSKKFSFKAEHKNMKTFYFAAEDKETMKRWMNMMSLATIMQNCAMLDQFDLSFSSVSYDEDSGFTSHHSSRFKSSEHNSTFDSCFSSTEHIRQRSNSCGDRMAELHLRSDDKYPTAYKTSSSHLYKTSPNNQEGPSRQPLYANAPPKPKRVTKWSPYSVSPSEQYYAIDHDCINDSSQYQYDKQLIYSHHLTDNQKNYQKSGPTCSSFGDTVFHVSGHFDAAFNQRYNFQSISKLPQPPRSHSAEFLERDTDTFTSVPVNYYEKPQPQRPKSSLESYNKFWKEEMEFDAYREAVRAQADNFYTSNKKMLRNQKFHAVWQPENRIANSELQIHHVGNSNHVEKDDQVVTRAISCGREIFSSPSSENNALVGHFNSKSAHEESMQKLLEWKKRVLQSPFSRQNNAQANTSSEEQPVPQQKECEWHVLRDLESCETNLPDNSLLQSAGYEPQQPQPYLKDHSNPLNNSCKIKSFHDGLDHGPEIAPDKFDTDNNLDGKSESNHVYCVDSENNGVIFSCDNSVTHDSESKPMQHTQMHSFSTMSNVNDISNDAYIIPDSGKHQRTHNFAAQNRYYENNSHEHQESTSSHLKVITYSSDDEDTRNKACGMTEATQTAEKPENNSLEYHLTYSEHTKSTSPDYVNISVLSKNISSDWEQGTHSEVVSEKSQLHLLGHTDKGCKFREKYDAVCSLKLVGKNEPVSIFSKSSIDLCVEKELTALNNDNSDSIKDDSLIKTFQCNESANGKCFNPVLYNERELDIKREDYYRASQIFYASTQMKNKVSINFVKHKQKSETRDFCDLTANTLFSQPKNDNSKDHLKISAKKFQYIDKDVGIPLLGLKNLSEIEIPSSQALQQNVPKQNLLNADHIKFDEYLLSGKKSNEIKNKESALASRNITSIFDFNSKNKKNLDDSKEQMQSKSNGFTLEKKLSCEEMRVHLRRKREAPPPNIVQERIKCFESVAVSQAKLQKYVEPMNENLMKFSTPDNFSGKDKYENRGMNERIQHIVGYSATKRSLHSDSETVAINDSVDLTMRSCSAAERSLHSDSEAVVINDSDDSSDDLTMRSAPILLSPLSSVLADLRKTANSGKDKIKHESKDPGKINSIKNYFRAFNEEFNLANPVKNQNNAVVPVCNSNNYLHSMLNVSEAEYLPMSGVKLTDEPEYVTMSGKLSSSDLWEAKYKSDKDTEEHLYNEPFSPPPSFLHDVYEKQKAKKIKHHIKNSSSEDSPTENIYEKPIHRFPSVSSMRKLENMQQSPFLSKSVPETQFMLITSHSCSNVTADGRYNEGNAGENLLRFKSDTLVGEYHHYEQAHLSVSVPDLLQLQKVKDSDASDADDEASRDFDMTGFSHWPAYQTPVFNHFSPNNKALVLKSEHSSYDLEAQSLSHREINSFNVDSQFSEALNSFSHHAGDDRIASEPFLQSSLTSEQFKLHLENSSHCDVLHDVLPQKDCEATDNERKIHVRKLRVYTNGKKPEGPKIFPVPLNIEESETLNNISKKDDDNPSSTNVPALHVEVTSLPLVTDSEGRFCDNVAYLSKKDNLLKNNNIVPNDSVLSYQQSPLAPDVVPSLCTGSKLQCDDLSPLSRPPTSPPYYYSDLLSGHNLNFSGQIPIFKRNDVMFLEKRKSPNSKFILLNNVRPQSPSNPCKEGVGRKVNKISNKESPPGIKIKSKIFSWNEETGLRSNLNCTLDMLQHKYLDTKNNKYDAGHTLKKTRSNSTIADFSHTKQQSSSTSKLKTIPFQHVGPVYENINFQKLSLQNRLSHSLECIPHVFENEFSEKCVRSTSPVYENIDFFLQEESFPRNTLNTTNHFEVDEKIQPTKTDVKLLCKSGPSLSYNEAKSKINAEIYNLDTDCFNHNVGQKPFLGKNDMGHLFLQDEGYMLVEKLTLQQLDDTSFQISSYNVDRNLNDFRKVDQSFGNVNNCDSYLIDSHKISSQTNESESTSIASSSCDEASADSDSRHQLSRCKLRKSHDAYNSEFKFQEPLRKLVEHAEGLMTKGRHLSVSAGDLLGKTHEELVLLLIQLRRNQYKLLSAKEKFQLHFGDEQVIKTSYDPKSETKHYNALHRQVQQLENQYEFNQPLVTLVDNMVKLGSLYGTRCSSCPCLDATRENKPNLVEELYEPDDQSHSFILSELLGEENNLQKIENASLKNDQLEHEILLLRQRLQQALKADTSETHNRADLEAELTRVQNVLEELTHHRHEINNTVEELKRKSYSKGAEVRASPTGVAGSAALPLRKKQHSMYFETDLDTMITRDLAIVHDRDFDDTPVYVNADEISNPNADTLSRDLNVSSDGRFISQSDSDHNLQCPVQDINDADERMKRFYGILPREKPCEIKTVRLVKRQSERRLRDKKRLTSEDESAEDVSSDEMEEGSSTKVFVPPSSRPSNVNLLASSNPVPKNPRSARERLFGKQGAPCYVQIGGAPTRSKRRHYTVSGHDELDAQYFEDMLRSRDDVDMERCLRTANTPDIVRSTMKKKQVFDDQIIERELGLPDKISIPERYIENDPEQLSAGEKLRRSLKAENIRKMLSETTRTYGNAKVEQRSTQKKLVEEKKERAHLLSLNRALAREVAEKTKEVAAFAALESCLKKQRFLEVASPLPIAQQRYSFLT